VKLRRGRVKRHDPTAPYVARLIRNRPWLGWRHRRPMEDYLRARKRSLLLQCVLVAGTVVLNIATGKLLAAPMAFLGAVHMLHRYRRMSSDPSGYEHEWQEIRDVLAAVDAERAAGVGRRVPPAWELLVLVVVLTLNAVGLKFMLHGAPWTALLAAGVAVGLVAGLVDVALHHRHAPPLGNRVDLTTHGAH